MNIKHNTRHMTFWHAARIPEKIKRDTMEDMDALAMQLTEDLGRSRQYWQRLLSGDSTKQAVQRGFP